jgi:sugar diacid utilization regulator
MVMTDSGDDAQILQLATTAIPALGRSRIAGVYLLDGGWRVTAGACGEPTVQADLVGQFARLGAGGGQLAVSGEGWGWAWPLRSLEGHFGYLVAVANAEPAESERFLQRVLAQQTGIALANARLHFRERATAEDLRTVNTALERSMAIHDRLTRTAVAGEGQAGIVKALHELTGYPIAIEDRHGTLLAWAGPDCPEPYPTVTAAERQAMLKRAEGVVGTIRHGDRLVIVANPREDVLAVLVLVDPSSTASTEEQMALEHGATVLSVELSRLHSVLETELRLGRDLLEDLLAGTDFDRAVTRARMLGYELEKPHCVLVVDCAIDSAGEGATVHAVRRAARDSGVGSLLASRQGAVVVLADADGPWQQFWQAVVDESGTSRCRVGVGGTCESASGFARSYRQAQLALKIQQASHSRDRVTVFDDLGVLQILAEAEDPATVDRFVHRWLGSLLDYDSAKGTVLVESLSRFLEFGGNYQSTAQALVVHRSTLRYRLQRIREVSGLDLSDPETQFNLQMATRAWQTLAAIRADPVP